MQKIMMFTMESCPYCVKARHWMGETLEEHPEYAQIEIEYVDELEEPELADTYDYWYVPTYYVGGVKVHEGAATKEIVENVFKSAYEG
jgi:glutaredoxin